MIRELVLILIAGCFGSAFISAQTRPLTADEKEKINLIGEIEVYAAEKLGMKLKREFYTRWEKPDSMTAYLYVSRADSMIPVKGASPFIFFGTRYLAADSAMNYYDSMGYHTLVYKTAGNSVCRLSSRLLQYPPHAIAFICFHELYHRHKQASHSKLLYNFEEATCDVIGNYAAIGFFKHYAENNSAYTKYIDSATLQANINERFYHVLTHYSSVNTVSVHDSIQQISRWFNLFQQDRFLYPVNNAFMLRTLFYARYYHLIRELFMQSQSFKYTIRYITSLKGTEETVVAKIKKKIR